MKRVFGHLCLPVCLLVLAVGCGNETELASVTGTVTFNGEPADSILVNFMPDPEKQTEGGMSSAITDDEGRFELSYQGEGKGKGAAVGFHRVVVNDLVPENFRGAGAPPESRVAPDLMSASRTRLRLEVKPGEQQFEIELVE
ncbi:MAG: hypothetical protein AAF989_07990 [Planctomycetota bacterium]